MPTLAKALKGFYEREPERVIITLQHPDQPDFHITYRELVERANDYAVALANAGVKPGEVVILLLQHGKDIVYSFWGAILLGAIPSIMPFLTDKLSPDRYRVDMGTLFSLSQPTAVVTYPQFETTCRQIVSDSNSRAQVLTTGQAPRQEFIAWKALPGLERQETDIALVQHSSGSTGLQKGIALSHRVIFNHLAPFVQALGLTQQDVIVSWLPLYHDMGLIANFMTSIMNGIHVIQMSPFDWVREPWRMLRAISDYRGTLTFLPNFAYNYCATKIRASDIEGVDLSSWHTAINGSEPISVKSHEMFYERFKAYGLRFETLQTGYGMAEVVAFATLTPNKSAKTPHVEDVDRESLLSERIARPAVPGCPSIQLVSSGRPISNTSLRVVDEQGTPLPERHIGEIILKSDCMLDEYYRRPDITKQAFTVDGWYKSGDYGFLLNGEVFFTGRKKDLIIVAGKNIYPQDLETLAGEVTGVHPGRTVAFGITDETQGTEIVVLMAEVNTADPAEREQIENEIREHVAVKSAVIIRRVHAVDPRWILKASNGKIARSANRAKFIQEFNGGCETIQ